MFIECRHCHTIYRIDEKKIPSQESFVRCSKCFNPITLKVEEKIASSRLPNKNIIECPECKARYLVFSEKIRDPLSKVRCGGCDHVFILSSSIIGKNLDDERSLSLLNESSLTEETVLAKSEAGIQTISVPSSVLEKTVEKESGDVKEEEKKDAGKSSSPPDSDDEIDASKAALEKYLDSVSLDSPEAEKDNSATDIDPIPQEHKDRLFLRPYSEVGSSPADSKRDEPEKKISESSLADGFEKKSLRFEDKKSDDLENEKTPEENERVAVKREDKRKIILICVAALALVLALGVGGWFFMKSKLVDTNFPSRNTISPSVNKSGLAIIEPLKGRYMINEGEGRIFVIEGKVINYYPKNVKISYLQIQGSLYSQYNKEIGDSNIYAGNVIEKKDLKKWPRKKIESFLDNKLGRSNVNLAIDSKQKIPFQVVFFEVPKNIYKIGAKISEFSKKEI